MRRFLAKLKNVFSHESGIEQAKNCIASGSDRAERIELLGTSFEYFRLLGANAALGRVIEPSDAVPGFTEAAVISDGLWRRQFGADPHVVGRRILVDEDAYTIVGVMPPDFRHPGQGFVLGIHWDLRRDGVRHRPAIAGVRHPHGAWSRASRHLAAGVPARRGPHRYWHRGAF